MRTCGDLRAYVQDCWSDHTVHVSELGPFSGKDKQLTASKVHMEDLSAQWGLQRSSSTIAKEEEQNKVDNYLS